MFGCFGQHCRGSGARVLMLLSQPGSGSFPFGGDPLPGLGSLALDLATQVLGVKVRVLSNRLRLVLCFPTRRLGLPASCGEEGSCLFLGLLQLALEVFM